MMDIAGMAATKFRPSPAMPTRENTPALTGSSATSAATVAAKSPATALRTPVHMACCQIPADGAE